jgi:hypothetical protein
VPALTLAGMRGHGVHSVDIECECGHEAVVNVDHLDGAIPVPNVRKLFKCSKCGAKPWRSMPDWSEMQAAGKPDTR